jgi:hypothetical protein
MNIGESDIPPSEYSACASFGPVNPNVVIAACTPERIAQSVEVLD